MFFVAVRMILAGSLLCGYLIARGYNKNVWHFLKRDWALFVQIILFHIYLTYICDLCALKEMTSIESAFIYNLSPFIAALFSYLWFNELMTRQKWFGLLLGFCAFLPQLLQPLSSEAGFGLTSSLSDLVTHAWPRILTLIAVISSAYGWIVLRALVKKGYSPLVANGVGMFFGGLAALGTSWHMESWTPLVLSWVPFIQATVLIVVVANLLFYNLYGYLLKHYTATLLSFAGFMCPLWTAIFGYVFFEETFSPSLLVSFMVVCTGLIIFYYQELKQGYVT